MAVRLYKSNGPFVNESQFWANGQEVSKSVEISNGGSYYFQYLTAYGATRALRVHMIIKTY